MSRLFAGGRAWRESGAVRAGYVTKWNQAVALRRAARFNKRFAASGERERRVSSAEIRAQLQRILASPVFATAERLSQFLSFIVEAALDGRAAEIKEYVIGARSTAAKSRSIR